ncbi:hypothetical protein IAU60_006824 [Kwoniella sp. DSM 27419]
MLFSTLFSIALLATPSFGFADKQVHELSRSRARSVYAQRAGSDADSATLEKRGSYSGRATYYQTGLGACGWYNSPGDFIVALNSAQYGGGYPSKQCGRSITISYNGKTVGATIADECPSCDFGGLDLSQGLFEQFADTGKGVFYMDWWFNDENQAPAPAPKPTTTSTPPPPPPTSTYTPPTSTYVPPTSTYTPPTSTYVEPSTAAASSSSSSTAAAASSANASPASSQAASASSSASSSPSASVSLSPYFQTNGTVATNATTTASADESQASIAADIAVGNLIMLNHVVANLGNIVVAGAEHPQ